MNRRVVINLIALGLASAALIVWSVADLLAGALFDETYPLSVELPQSGGLIQGQEVTVSGRVVGLVEDVDLDGEHVVALLKIYADERVPTNTDVLVQRRSSVGEQAIEFTPRDEPEGYYEPGDTVEALDAVTPIEVQRLLRVTERTFGAVDPETAGALVSELADAVRGRRDDLRSIVRESADFSTTMADGGDEFERLFREGRVVTEALADVRESFGRSIGHMADSAAILSDMRADFEQLLVDAPPALAQLGGVVGRSQANIACIFGHLGEINAFMAQPGQMAEGERAFRANQWFFQGFKYVTPESADGRIWNRVHVMSEEDPPPERYAQKRPIPATLPGGACSSVFGDGAPSAMRDDTHFLVHPEGRIVPPDDARVEPVRVAGPPLSRPGTAPGTAAPRGQAAPGAQPVPGEQPAAVGAGPDQPGAVPTPALTGLGIVALLLAAVSLLTGGAVVERSAGRRARLWKRD